MDRTLLITLAYFTVVLLFAYLLFTIMAPFLATLVWATTIGIITRPLHIRLLLYCRGHAIVAATLMTTGVVLALVIPLIGLLFSLSSEAAAAYQYLERATAGTAGFMPAELMRHPSLAPWLERIRPLTGPIDQELETLMLPAIKKGLGTMLMYSTGILKNFFGFLFKLVLMLITLFFVYKDGDRFLQRFWQVSDIDDELKQTLQETVSRVLNAVMYGVVLTCMVQGALGGLGFWVAGLPSPFLFGTFMALSAPIPVVGTSLVWLPGSAYLFIQGQTLPAILLIVWCILVVSSIDNILRPLFISGKAKLPILVIVFGVLGGFLAFGFSGVVIGPVILAVTLVLLDRWRPPKFSEQQKVTPSETD